MRAPRMQPRDRADAAPVARTSLARADLVALAVVVVGGLLVRLALALWMPGPIVHADETGSLALARHLVGDGRTRSSTSIPATRSRWRRRSS